MRRLRVFWWVPALLIAGCATTPKLPQPPKVVTEVVHVHDPAPAWATAPLVKPVLAGPTVADHLQREHALDALLDVANCGRALLKQLSDGKAVDPKTCEAHP